MVYFSLQIVHNKEVYTHEKAFYAPAGGDVSLNPNSTYTRWEWILVRSNGGSWRHVDHGYG